MKSSRQTRILEIISENMIETQDDLIEKLRESGYPVTQATVSRDIKQLGLVKTSSKTGVYHYAATKQDTGRNLKSILRETVTSIQSAGNIVVVKTYSGMANAAAAIIDSLSENKIVGSIAGDDTIFIVVKNEEEAVAFVEHIKENF